MGRTTFASYSSGNAESLLPEEQGRVLHVLDEFYIVNTGCDILTRLEIPAACFGRTPSSPSVRGEGTAIWNVIYTH